MMPFDWPHNYADEIAIKTVLLERFRLGWSRIVPRHTLAHTNIEWIIEDMAEGALCAISMELYGEHLERRRISYPKDWWEHARDHFYVWLGHGWDGFGHWPWFGDFCRKHWPIQYRTIEIDVRCYYPSLPGTEHFIHVVRAEMPDA
jgi:hypothetical protein